MCTGDNIDTASAISKDAGILNDKDWRRGKNGEWEEFEHKAPEAGQTNFRCMIGEDFRKHVGT